jgi:hypothetical protein
MAARKLKLHLCAPYLTDDRSGNKERYIPEIEMGEYPCNEDEGYRDMDTEKPLERIPLCPFPEITEREVDDHCKCEKYYHMDDF